MILIRLDEMMKRRGIKTQGDLAKKVGLSENSISSIKKGNGRIENLGKLCLALECQPNDLLVVEPDE